MAGTQRPIPPGWVRIEDPASGRLLAIYDPVRCLIELECVYWDKDRHSRVRYKVIYDLSQILPPDPSLVSDLAGASA